MTLLKRWARTGATMFLLNTTAWVPGARAAEIASPLAGSWTLVAADVLHADGTRGRDYGAAPFGRLLIDRAWLRGRAGSRLARRSYYPARSRHRW